MVHISWTPKGATIGKMIHKIDDILDDPKVNLSDIAVIVNISKEPMHKHTKWDATMCGDWLK